MNATARITNTDETDRQAAIAQAAQESHKPILATPAIIDRCKAELNRLPFADLVAAARQFYPSYNALPGDERNVIIQDILTAAFTGQEIENWCKASIQPGEYRGD